MDAVGYYKTVTRPGSRASTSTSPEGQKKTLVKLLQSLKRRSNLLLQRPNPVRHVITNYWKKKIFLSGYVGAVWEGGGGAYRRHAQKPNAVLPSISGSCGFRESFLTLIVFVLQIFRDIFCILRIKRFYCHSYDVSKVLRVGNLHPQTAKKVILNGKRLNLLIIIKIRVHSLVNEVMSSWACRFVYRFFSFLLLKSGASISSFIGSISC